VPVCYLECRLQRPTEGSALNGASMLRMAAVRYEVTCTWDLRRLIDRVAQIPERTASLEVRAGPRFCHFRNSRNQVRPQRPILAPIPFALLFQINPGMKQCKPKPSPIGRESNFIERMRWHLGLRDPFLQAVL
jgi:hypothetical protein